MHPQNILMAKIFGRAGLWAALFVLMLSGVSACGGDPCADVDCDFGLCRDGVCENPAACNDDRGCLAGYECSSQGQCQAMTECEDDFDCPTGVCSSGVCVNPSTCRSNNDCLPRTYCSEAGTCDADPCARFECERGTCLRGTEQCVSKESCTLETEAQDCVDGEQCLDGSCYAEQEYCEALDCQQGLCSFARRSCVNADDCQGDDSRCAEGYYCDGDDECTRDLCEVNDVDCSEGGTCKPRVGECENISPCSSQSDCVSGHVCVEEQCRLAELACGDDGCPGNQICEYDSATLSASCEENPSEPCTTSLDCAEERQCGGQSCLPPLRCENDSFEPNDAEADATDFNVNATGVSVRGVVCSADADHFTVDLRQIPDLPLRGTLIITAEYTRRDIGLGELEMNVVEPDGDVVGSDTGGAMGRDGMMQVRAELTAVSPREYVVEIRDTGDVAKSGVEYELSVEMHERETLDACQSPTELTSSGQLLGDTASSAIYGFGSTCTTPRNGALDDLYQFEVTEPSRATITVIPQDSQTDLSVSVRSSCERLDSEVGCRDGATSGAETLTRLLEPGTYFAVVQASSVDQPGGAYQISLRLAGVDCTPQDSACVDIDNADVCAVDGSGFITENCDLGCDPRTGTCFREQGDLCRDPLRVADGDVVTVEWNDFRNDYQMPANTCLEDDFGTDTDGADAVYSVSLPAGHGLQASLEFPSSEDGSVYILTNCLDPASACVGGSNQNTGSTEVATYFNDTGLAQTLYVVADSRTSAFPSSATLSIETGERICRPDELRCTTGGDVEICNDIGTRFGSFESCNFGCTDGICNPPPNQTCSGAIALTSGQPVTQSIRDYQNDFENDPHSDGCTGDAEDGKDAVYKITTTQPGQLVDVVVDAAWDVSVTMARHCFGAQMQCLAASDVSSNPETLTFTAREAGDYFLVIDTDDTSASGDFTITATVRAPACNPGEVTGCNGSSLEYCDASGTPSSYTCTGGCSNAACDTPSADSCVDAQVLAHGDTITDSLGGANAIEIPGRRIGGCVLDSGDDMDGREKIYRVDLNAGDLLSADLSGASSSTHLFVVEDCFFAAESCAANNPQGGAATLNYYADSARSVYLLVDSSSSSSSDSFTLGIDITQGAACAPGETVCVDANTVQRCNQDGSAVLNQYSCGAGSCAGGGCFPDLTTADTCSSAPDVGNGIAVYGDYSTLSNSVEVASSGCTGDRGDGNDLVYSVTLAADELLLVRAEGHGSEDPMVYIVSDCTDPTNTCLAGQNGDASDVAELRYQASAPETVYVVADTDSSYDDEAFSLYIDKRPAECSATTPSVCLDQRTEEYCDAGLFAQRTCYYGAGCLGGSCELPTNDTCSGAPVVPRDGNPYVYEGNFDDFADDYNAGFSSCMGGNSPGPDAVYRVDALAGDVIEATWTGSNDPALWITTDCATASNSCVAGVEDNSAAPVSLTYVAPSDGAYYIIGDVDEDSSTTMDTFRLDVTVGPPECQASVDPNTCVDANTLQYCGQYNTWEQRPCAAGCSNGGCLAEDCTSPRDVTADALQPGGTLIQGVWRDFSHDLGGSGCGISTSDTDGQDLVLTASLAAGEQITVSMTNPDNPSVWYADPTVAILSSCGDISTATCLAGDTGADAPATASYRATTAQLVYIVADHDSTASSALPEPFDLTVDIQ